MKKDKRIAGIEEEKWNWFVGWIKQKGTTVTKYLEAHIDSLKK